MVERLEELWALLRRANEGLQHVGDPRHVYEVEAAATDVATALERAGALLDEAREMEPAARV